MLDVEGWEVEARHPQSGHFQATAHPGLSSVNRQPRVCFWKTHSGPRNGFKLPAFIHNSAKAP